MNWIIKLDQNTVKLNRHVPAEQINCLDHGSFSSKVIVQTNTHTHAHIGPTAIRGPHDWSVASWWHHVVTQVRVT